MGGEGRLGSGGALEYITARMCDPPPPLSLLYMSVRRWAGKKEAADEEEEEEEEGKVHATEPTSTKLTLTIM